MQVKTHETVFVVLGMRHHFCKYSDTFPRSMFKSSSIRSQNIARRLSVVGCHWIYIYICIYIYSVYSVSKILFILYQKENTRPIMQCKNCSSLVYTEQHKKLKHLYNVCFLSSHTMLKEKTNKNLKKI